MIRFSEKISAASALVSSHYSIPGITIAAATLASDSATVRLSVSGMTNVQSLVLTVTDIADKAATPNVLSSSGGLPFVCRAGGFVFQETWTGITGDRIADLTNSPKYGSAPDKIDTLRTLQAKTIALGNCGSRIWGYFCPGETGDYRFWITSNDASQLFVSTDSLPSNKTLLARVESWFPAGQFDFTSVQFSQTPQRLIKDKKYYFEILHKQGSGSGHCTVAWQRIGGAPRAIAPAECILPYPDVPTPTAAHEKRSSLSSRPLRSPRFQRDMASERMLFSNRLR
jgi:hypothetical protein